MLDQLIVRRQSAVLALSDQVHAFQVSSAKS